MVVTETYFADTWYWVALVNKSDQHHSAVRRIARDIGKHPIVTSEMVFNELLGSFAKERVRHLRKLAVALIKALESDPSITIVRQTPEQFQQAIRHYEIYHDKLWSLTDCASMLIMKAHNLDIAITDDHHFEQASFKIRNA